MSDWEEVQLKDIVSVLGDGLHGTPEYSDDGEYYFINGNNLDEGSIVINKETQRVSHSEYLKYKKRLSDRTLLVSINGTLGNVAYYKSEKILLGKSACYFNLLDNVNKGFIRYILSTPYFQKYIQTYANGSTIKNVPLKAMREFSFNLPPLQEQKQIADILSCLDRKISNLRQQNETLEAIAQTLFKHWFVDFEFPNEDGKPYKSSGGEMGRSELGEIPVGWRVETLEECLEHLIDNRGKTPEYFDSGIPALSAKFVKGSDLVNRDSFNHVSPELFEQSDKLRIGDVILTSEAPLGETYFIAKETRYYPAQRVFALRANKSIISCSYLNYWLNSPTGQFVLKRRASGSTVQGIKQSELYQCEVIVPDSKIQDRVSEALTKILSKKELNSDQIQTLTKTRDVLLPKLMSGKLRITEL